MKTTINFSQFCDAFRSMDRNNNFSYEGKRTLFDWLESYEEDTDEELELDVVALCCEYNENDWQTIASDYRVDLSECEDDEEREQAVIEYLQENTSYIGDSDSGCHVYAQF